MSLISPRSKPLIALHLDASGLRAEKHPKAVSTERRLEARARREVYRQLGNIVVEAHKYSGLAIDTLVAIAKDGQTDSSRQSAAVELLNRGYGRPAQSVDLHLTTEAITRRLSDMTDADLATLEARMIAAAIAPQCEGSHRTSGDRSEVSASW